MKKFEYKSQEDLEKMSAEELKTYHAEMKAFEKSQTEEAIKNAVKPVEDAQKEVSKDLDAIKQDLKVIKEDVKSKASSELKGYLHTVVKENYKKIVDAFKNKGDLELVVEKVAAMHMTNNGTVSNISGLTMPVTPFEVDNEIAYIRVPENFVLRVIRNSQREKVPAQIIKRQQVAKEGAIAVVAEGEVKPLNQYKFQNTSTSRVKYAGRIEWTEEFEMDFEALLDAIIDLFERDVITAWQDGLLGIIETNAVAYVGSSLDGTLNAPDYGLAIVAAAQQIRALGYTPNFAWMNPADIDAAIYTQDSNGNFQLKPYIGSDGNRIAGIQVIPTLKVDAGEAIVGDFSVYKEIHSRVILRRGQYGTQFIENEYTLIGEVFSILSAAPANYPAVVKLNLATVVAALTKDETP